ncbi:transcription factor IIIB 50 kDa subunit-like [Centruroides vittatus]|uniref:transcription factor IIIB 50 kDa subunit-like n=1 Tax=Centruroides vittatus TaxID=120091 RepID=UPI00350FDF02
MEKCPECNECSVEKDFHFAQEQLVCTSCGYVVSEENLQSETNLEGTTLVSSGSRQSVRFNVDKLPKSINVGGYEKICEGKHAGLERIKYLKSVLNFGQDTADEINELYLKMFRNENFARCSLRNKIALSGCCAYVVLRRRGWPVLVSSVCNLLQCTASEFNRAFTTMRELTGVGVTTPRTEELIPVVLKNVDLGEERERIYGKVTSLLRLASRCWLTAGRIPQPCIVAAAFVAWKSLSQKRLNCSFKKFCDEKKVKEYFVTSRKRLNELNDALLKLAEKLPWVEKNELRVKHVPYLLDDVARKFSSSETQFEEFRKASKRRAEREEENEGQTFSENFEDSEIDSYIRTEEEVAIVKNLEKKLKSNS